MFVPVERRRNPRVVVDVPVTLRYKGRFIPAVTKDISVSGLSVLTNDPAISNEGAVEVVADLSYQLKDVALTGTIVRVTSGREKTIAIRFTNPKSPGFFRLEEFVKNRQQQV